MFQMGRSLVYSAFSIQGVAHGLESSPGAVPVLDPDTGEAR
jgi:hypothetical protein